ncbi:MAG: caspase family protein [Deltaproteobacteria bacterium]|nr:caspase family protein [Deltaproteobacteria bacterium]
MGSNAAPPGLNPLRYTHNDARKMRGVLVELGGLEPGDAVVLFDPSVKEVRDALAKLRAQAAAGDGQELIFYYSGHSSESALLLGKEKLPFSEVRGFLRDEKAKVRLAIIDSCRSGALSRVKGGKMRPGVDIRWTSEPPVKGAVLITSSTAEEASVERDDVGGSLFSHFFVSGLRGAADADDDGSVTLEEVFLYAYNHTLERSTESRSGAQHPTYEYRIAGQRQLVLSRLKQPSFMSFGEELAGTYVVFDRKRNQVVAELTKEPGSRRRLWLPPGDYYIKKRLPSAVLLQKVTMKKGVEHAVKDHEMRTVPFEEDVTKGRMSKVFRPTWKHGAPFIPNTAHTLRRGELSLGLRNVSVGVADSVMLSTSVIWDALLTPNLNTKVRLIHSDSWVWSMHTGFYVSFLSRAIEETERSSMGLEVGTTLSLVALHWMTVSMFASWAIDSQPTIYYESEEDDNTYALDWETQNVTGGLSFTWYMGERNLIQLTGEVKYIYLVPEWTSIDEIIDWGGTLLYAHAWKVFRLAVGVSRDSEITDSLTIKANYIPYLDFWWRW